MGGRSENHSIAFPNQIIDAMVRIGKCRGERPFETLEFVAVHGGGTKLLSGVMLARSP